MSKRAARPAAPVLLGLLRGINVGGNKKVPMADLRTLAEGLGLQNVRTYINSGNLLFRSDLEPAAAELALERAIERRFGFPVEVVVRTAEAWERYAAKSTFPDAEVTRPKVLHLAVAKQPLAKGAAAALQAAARGGERVHALADALWIDFGESVARSKLSPAVLDRHAGSTVTARNWRTVQTLAELARALAAGP